MPTRALFVVSLLAAGCTENNVNRIAEAPLVTVLSPAPGEIVRQSADPLPFEAVVEDSYDAPEELEVLWQLGELEGLALPDAEGFVQFSAPTDALPLGDLRLTVTAVDSDGDMGEDSARYTLAGPLGAPEVRITAPEDGAGFDPGDTIAFRGEADDLSTPLDQLDFAWSSDLDGPLDGDISGGGESALITDALSEGEHLITLTVTDSDGDQGSDTVLVTVGRVGGGVVEDALPGDLVFSEMMINPDLVYDEVGEWVELYNTASYAIDVGGYSFHDDDYDHYALVGPLIVQGGDYLVLCASTNRAENGGVDCDGWFFRDYQGNGLALANHEDEVVLSRPDGVEIDWLHYDEDWFQMGVAIGIDPSFMTSGANDDRSHWCDQVSVMESGEYGTPGRENDRCE